jgi:chromosomal replication initiator protein
MNNEFVAPVTTVGPTLAGAAIRVADIQTVVAHYYGVPVEAMRTPSAPGKNAHKIAHPRQVAMFLATELTDHSTTRIGDFFGGRDHTTVLHAVKEVSRRAEKLGPTRLALSRIRKHFQEITAAQYGMEIAA